MATNDKKEIVKTEVKKESKNETKIEVETESSFFFENRVIFISIFSVTFVLFLISTVSTMFLYFNNSSLEHKLSRLDERLVASVLVACKVDYIENPKQVSFVREENKEGDKVLVLKCIPQKKKE